MASHELVELPSPDPSPLAATTAIAPPDQPNRVDSVLPSATFEPSDPFAAIPTTPSSADPTEFGGSPAGPGHPVEGPFPDIVAVEPEPGNEKAEATTDPLPATLTDAAAIPPAASRFSWEAPQRARHPAATAAWATVCGIAALALALQALHAWRSEIALHLPATRGALEQLCEWTRCQIEPVRRLSDLAVESSELSQLGGTIYRIGIVIRNSAEVARPLPHLDITLSDVKGAVIARRAIAPLEFGLTSSTIAARERLSLQGHLNAGDSRVAGYTIELFHP